MFFLFSITHNKPDHTQTIFYLTLPYGQDEHELFFCRLHLNAFISKALQKAAGLCDTDHQNLLRYSNASVHFLATRISRTDRSTANTSLPATYNLQEPHKRQTPWVLPFLLPGPLILNIDSWKMFTVFQIKWRMLDETQKSLKSHLLDKT